MTGLRALVAHEWRLLRTTASTWIALGLLAACVLFGAANGGRWAEFRRESAERALTAEVEQFDELRRKLASPEGAWPRPDNAAHVGFQERAAVLPPAPLAPLAVGHSDVMPHHLRVSTRSLASTHTKSAEELGNPQVYVTGSFDTAFALVVVIPLVALALLFDLVSGERERGTLPLVLSQPIGPRALVVAKAGLRWLLITIVASTFTVVGLASVGADLGADPTGLAIVVASIAAYVGFWTALAVFVAGRGWGSPANALALASVFIVMVVVVPGLVGMTSRALRPVPSRAHLVEAQRDAETHHRDRGLELLVAYYEEHPDTRPADFDPDKRDFALTFTAVQGAVHDEVAPLLHRYDSALAAQERLACLLAVLSPPAVLQGALESVAGSDHARHAAYVAQVATFHARHREFFTPRAFRQAPLTEADYDARPQFVFEEPTGARPLWSVAVLGLLTLALLAAAAPSLRRLSTH